MAELKRWAKQMVVHDIINQEGRVFAFEVDNLTLSRDGITRFIESIQGVRVVRRPKRFLSALREEVFLEFEFEGRRFEVWEPFGDNSRYWIGAEPAEWCEQLDRIRASFLEPKEEEPNQPPEPMPLKRHGSS